MSAIRIQNLTPAADARFPNISEAILFPSVSGTALLADASRESQHVRVAVISVDHLPASPSEALSTSDRTRLAGFIVAFAAYVRGGHLEFMLSDAISDELLPLVAATTAVLQYSYGWDESAVIVAHIGVEQFPFAIRYEGEHTFSAVAAVAA